MPDDLSQLHRARRDAGESSEEVRGLLDNSSLAATTCRAVGAAQEDSEERGEGVWIWGHCERRIVVSYGGVRVKIARLVASLTR
jgi:hypothetical protein